MQRVQFVGTFVTLENACHYEYTGIKSSREIWTLYSNLQVEKQKKG